MTSDSVGAEAVFSLLVQIRHRVYMDMDITVHCIHQWTCSLRLLLCPELMVIRIIISYTVWGQRRVKFEPFHWVKKPSSQTFAFSSRGSTSKHAIECNWNTFWNPTLIHPNVFWSQERSLVDGTVWQRVPTIKIRLPGPSDQWSYIHIWRWKSITWMLEVVITYHEQTGSR